jgi:undecaprenyl-diphosphatase
VTDGSHPPEHDGVAAYAVRHPGDIVRVVVGLTVLALGALAANRGRVGTLEKDIFRVVNDLPDGVAFLLETVMQAGAFPAIVVAATVALIARRPRAARDLAVSGVAGWLVAIGMKRLVAEGRPAELLSDVVLRGAPAHGFGFPSGHVAVAAALATAAGPHLPRPARRAAWAVVVLVAIGRMYVGAHLPIDVVGGAALGWAAGALVHLLFGAPGHRPSVVEIGAAFMRAGFGPVTVTPAAVDARGSTPFFVTTHDGHELFVKVVGREQRDADALFKTWRALVYRELEDEAPFTTPKREIEHEAYVSLLAERAGVQTPPVVLAIDAGPGDTLLAERRVNGRALDTFPPDEIDDRLLASLWDQVARLRMARLAHRDLRRANVLVGDDGRPWVIDFGFAESAASDRRLAQDVAELLASLASLVGPPRAIASAVSGLGADAVGAALPLIQPLALSSATRQDLKAHPGLLDDLRRQVCETLDLAPTKPEQLTRIRPRTLITVVALGVAVHLLLPQVAELGQTTDAIRSARWGWLAVAAVLSAATYLGAALGQQGAVSHRLALLRTTAVQVASSFANRLTPGSVGGIGINVRYLVNAGIDRAEAIGAVALNTVAGIVVHVAGLVVALALVSRSEVGDTELPRGWPVLAAVVLALAGLGIALRSPVGRSRLVSPMVRATRSLGDVLRRPAKATELFGGSALLTASYALALAASLKAFGADADLVKVVAVYLGSAAVASFSPTPGGLGAIEAALVAGLTAVGVAHGPAIAGVLTFRLVTYWLPILPGWWAFHSLQRRGVV